MAEEQKHVISITVAEQMGSVSVLNVDFSDGKSAYMIESYANASDFIDKDVIVSFRKDVKDGNYEDFINTIAKVTQIVTLDKEDHIKLYVSSIPDTGSNVIFKDLQLAENKTNCIVYCDGVSVGSSPKASWVEFRVLDKKRNIAMMKVFNPEHYDMSPFKGRYLLCDVRKTKYGLTSNAVNIMENLTIEVNPELELARQYVVNSLVDDPLLMNDVASVNLIDAMLHYAEDGLFLETGYVLMQTAMELDIAANFVNLSDEVDYTLLKRAILASKLYVLTHNNNQTLSKTMQCVMKSTSLKISSKKLIALLEETPEVEMLEHRLMRQIGEMVSTLLCNVKSEGLRLSSDKIWGGR